VVADIHSLAIVVSKTAVRVASVATFGTSAVESFMVASAWAAASFQHPAAAFSKLI